MEETYTGLSPDPTGSSLPPAKSKPKSSSLLIPPMSTSIVSVSQSWNAETIIDYCFFEFPSQDLFTIKYFEKKNRRMYEFFSSFRMNILLQFETWRSVSIAESRLWLWPTDLCSILIRLSRSFSAFSIFSRRSLFSLLSSLRFFFTSSRSRSDSASSDTARSLSRRNLSHKVLIDSLSRTTYVKFEKLDSNIPSNLSVD